MKLSLIYTANAKGFNLELDLTATIKDDAEGLGYISSMLMETSETLIRFIETLDPKYRDRIANGMIRCSVDKSNQEGNIFPFTKLVIEDEV